MKTTIKHFVQGGLIGIGNIIPGVSGATVALILGIYKKLITLINSLNIHNLLAILKSLGNYQQFKEEMRRVEASFLVTVFVGVLTFVYIFSFAISYFLKNHHDATYSLFFGLILASVVIPLQLIRQKTWYGWMTAILAATLVVSLSFGMTLEDQINAHNKKVAIKEGNVQQKQQSTQLGYYFLAGAVAISAMILPGISGSFILLLMGSYFDILLAIKQLNIPVLLFFGSGCFLGLIVFAKILKYLLEKYESILMFFLLGLIVGSLYSIWPFKELQIVDGVTFYGKNIMPNLYTLNFLVCSVVCVIGIGIVLGFRKYEG